MEYQIITDTNTGSLARKVESAMRQGWTAQGGVAIDVKLDDEGATVVYAQAMIRED